MAVIAVGSLEILVGSPAYKEAERRLLEWGRETRQKAQALGYPTSSGLARMIEQVKVHEQLRKGVRKPLKRSKLVKADPNADAKAVSLEIRHSDTEKVIGKDTFSMRLSKVQFSASALTVEEIVKRLDNDEQRTLQRSYLFGQEDRRAAQELRMPKERYRNARESAVINVAQRLATRAGRQYSA